MFQDIVCRCSIQNYAPVTRLWKNRIINDKNEVYFTRYGLDGEGEIAYPSRPAPRPTQPLCNVYRFSSPGFEWPGCGADHPSLSIAGVEYGRPIPLPPFCVFILSYVTAFAFTFTLNHWYKGYSKWLSYTIHLRQEYMFFLFNRTTLQVFVTYLTGALYVHPFVILQTSTW